MTAIVEVIGISGGVVDQLREQKRNIEAFNASVFTKNTDRSGELGFINTRSAAWWNLRELLDQADGATLALPPIDSLTGDPTGSAALEGHVGGSDSDRVEGRHPQANRPVHG